MALKFHWVKKFCYCTEDCLDFDVVEEDASVVGCTNIVSSVVSHLKSKIRCAVSTDQFSPELRK